MGPLLVVVMVMCYSHAHSLNMLVGDWMQGQ